MSTQAPEGNKRLRRWVAPEAINAVFLDAGNTLVFLDFEAIAEAVREAGLSMDALRMEQAELAARRRADRKYMEGGARDANMWVLYFTWMLEIAGVPEARISETLGRLRQRHDESNLWRRSRPEIRTALERIRASGRKLAVISNSDGTCRELLRRMDLLGFFEAVYDSTEVGVEKPNPAIFELALKELNLRPSETLHVGDLEAADVLGARRAGIFPVLVDPANKEMPADHLVLESVAELPVAMEIEF
jgi:putative hydrolase of the HAD superfamily